MSIKSNADTMSLYSFVIGTNTLMSLFTNKIITKEQTLDIIDESISMIKDSNNEAAKDAMDSVLAKLTELRSIVDDYDTQIYN